MQVLVLVFKYNFKYLIPCLIAITYTIPRYQGDKELLTIAITYTIPRYQGDKELLTIAITYTVYLDFST